jgi:hypothetical protein
MISTYANLQTEIANMLNRPDLVASGDCALFIQLAEAQMKRELRKVVAVEAFTFTTGTSSKALPATLSEFRSIAPAVSVDRPRGGKALVGLTWEEFVEKRANLAETGTPAFYTILDQTIYVCPAPIDEALDFTITSFSALVSVTLSTTLLLEAPDLYLYGPLVHSALFLEHDERLSNWAGLFTDAVTSLNEKRQREEFGTGIRRARLPRQFAGGGRVI